MGLDADTRFVRASRYDPAWLRREPFGANVLWLAEWLGEALPLEPGMHVLDLGCGHARSSVFLAKEHGVRVTAADLWVPAESNARTVEQAGVADLVECVSADARHLPFDDGAFDAVVALDSFQYFGTDDLYLNHLARFVKPGGQIGFASAGLMRDFEDCTVPEHLTRFWGEDAWCLHTASWWRAHWGRTSLVDVESAEELPDGWRWWLDWSESLGDVSDWYLDTLRTDAGRYLGYIRVVARRTDAAPWTPPSALAPRLEA